MAWAPKFGLKGMIDASVRVRTDTISGEASEIIMPLEFKTGKGTSGQVINYQFHICERATQHAFVV